MYHNNGEHIFYLCTFRSWIHSKILFQFVKYCCVASFVVRTMYSTVSEKLMMKCWKYSPELWQIVCPAHCDQASVWQPGCVRSPAAHDDSAVDASNYYWHYVPVTSCPMHDDRSALVIHVTMSSPFLHDFFFRSLSVYMFVCLGELVCNFANHSKICRCAHDMSIKCQYSQHTLTTVTEYL